MASATSATRVMLPNAATKSLHTNSRCSLPLRTLHPLAFGNSAEISVSLSFFAGMAHSSGIGWCSTDIMRRARYHRKNPGFAGENCGLFERLQRFFVECRGEFHYRRGFL